MKTGSEAKSRTSPGPWVIDENSEGLLGIWGNDDALVCMAPDAGSENVPPVEVIVGNLEKVVRAVNAQDELVQALRDARMLLMMNRAVAGSATMTRINNAIAKAEGGRP
jgi:hypothetical protein